jgi:hypothetical protein
MRHREITNTQVLTAFTQRDLGADGSPRSLRQ